ncbi:Peroxidase [Mycena indigotica]|uniref:Peroxidase n=1 Tax=Mycena indigotica TaxID=2126181 RepID=A0A8H6WBG5_9AGAR|nr:Peroxidase [Mycena indigotica]KAF7312599.1 Peroxidase [Mycena indigotica]
MATTSANKLKLLLLASISVAQVLAYTWPNPAYDYVEEFLWLELTGFAAIPALCGPNAANPNGTTPSIQAQWLRTAYHDMATFNAGVGGIDGSLFFELDRAENVGVGLSNTRNQFIKHISKYTPIPDLIAAGAVVAVGQCGGPSIPFKPGRVMAAAAGPSGVPVPTGSLADHTAAFQRQGFTATEMIGLVACGHTLGGVTPADFPSINTGTVIAPFDDTRTFDNHIATNYISGPNINPLVKGPAVTDSDARIFASDGNVTMNSFASSATTFNSVCASLLSRMINTVPTGVTLRDPVVPIPFKPRDFLLSITPSGTLNLQVTADIFGASVINPSRVVTLHWADRKSTTCASGACSASPTSTTSNAALRNGNTLQSYKFSVTVSATASFSSFWFTVDEAGNGANVVTQNNGGANYPVDDTVVNVPAYSCGLFSGSNIARITTAVRTDGTTQASGVSVEAMFQNQVAMRADLTTVAATLGTSPIVSPVSQYAYYTALIPGDSSLSCQYLNFEFSATFGGVVHAGALLGGACNVRSIHIAAGCSST